MVANVENLFYVGTVPWRGPGKKVSADITCAEAIKEAGLDWTVSVRPGYFYPNSGLNVGMVPNPGCGNFIVRDSDETALGMCGANYRPSQNVDKFAWFDPLIKSGAATLETAGSLQNGRRVWILAKLAGDSTLIGSDIANRYLLLSDSFDGKSSMSSRLTGIIVVCSNTLAVAERGGKMVQRAVHSGNMQRKLEDMKVALGYYEATWKSSTEVYRRLAETPITAEQLRIYTQTVFPSTAEKEPYSRNAKKTILAFASGDMGMAKRDATFWKAYQSVTQVLTHEKGREANRVNENWFGASAKTNTFALELATDMAGVEM